MREVVDCQEYDTSLITESNRYISHYREQKFSSTHFEFSYSSCGSNSREFNFNVECDIA